MSSLLYVGGNGRGIRLEGIKHIIYKNYLHCTSGVEFPLSSSKYTCEALMITLLFGRNTVVCSVCSGKTVVDEFKGTTHNHPCVNVSGSRAKYIIILFIFIIYTYSYY